MESQTIVDATKEYHKPIAVGILWIFQYFTYCVLDPHRAYTWYGLIGSVLFTLFFGFLGVASFRFMESIDGLVVVVKFIGEVIAVGISCVTLFTLIKKARGKQRRSRK